MVGRRRGRRKRPMWFICLKKSWLGRAEALAQPLGRKEPCPNFWACCSGSSGRTQLKEQEGSLSWQFVSCGVAVLVAGVLPGGVEVTSAGRTVPWPPGRPPSSSAPLSLGRSSPSCQSSDASQFSLIRRPWGLRPCWPPPSFPLTISRHFSRPLPAASRS